MQRGPLELTAGEPLKIHIFVDRSVVEVFANNRQCLTKQIYPVLLDARADKNIKTAKGDTPTDYAQRRERLEEIIRLLQ